MNLKSVIKKINFKFVLCHPKFFSFYFISSYYLSTVLRCCPPPFTAAVHHHPLSIAADQCRLPLLTPLPPFAAIGCHSLPTFVTTICHRCWLPPPAATIPLRPPSFIAGNHHHHLPQFATAHHHLLPLATTIYRRLLD